MNHFNISLDRYTFYTTLIDRYKYTTLLYPFNWRLSQYKAKHMNVHFEKLCCYKYFGASFCNSVIIYKWKFFANNRVSNNKSATLVQCYAFNETNDIEATYVEGVEILIFHVRFFMINRKIDEIITVPFIITSSHHFLNCGLLTGINQRFPQLIKWIKWSQ